MKCYQSGVCCKLFLINLNEQEYLSGEYETVFEEKITNYAEATEKGAIFLKQQEDGSCIYLKDNLCSIHQKRPQVCRGFFCDSKAKKFEDMVTQVNNYKIKNKIPIV